MLVCTLLSPLARADDNLKQLIDKPAVTVTPSPPQTSAPDCTHPNQDARCHPPRPDYRPQPYYRRPIIINPTPAAPPIDTSALKDDWEGCRSAKLNAIHSRDSGNLEQANRLDEWLWKNCRSYSEELRDLEQDQM